MSHCHDDHCHSHSHESTGCNKGCSCSCHDHHDEEMGCHFSEQLLELADEAWMEVLKEKIKEQILKSPKQNLDELAKIVNDANHQKWHELIAEKHNGEDFKSKLHDFFSKKK